MRITRLKKCCFVQCSNVESLVRLEPEPQAARIVQGMYQMVQDGMGCKEIAKTLNAEGIPTVKGKRWSTQGPYKRAGCGSIETTGFPE